MIPDDEHLYLDATQLYERGWSETLIKRFLVHSERRIPVDHWLNYQGKRSYFLKVIRNMAAVIQDARNHGYRTPHKC
jgi:hypothetical protein